MSCSIVDLSTLTAGQRAQAARIPREALAWADFAEPGAAEPASLYGRELLPNVLEAAAGIAPTNGHAFTLYRRCGYEVVDALPHANGFGRPDIFMANRIG